MRNLLKTESSKVCVLVSRIAVFDKTRTACPRGNPPVVLVRSEAMSSFFLPLIFVVQNFFSFFLVSVFLCHVSKRVKKYVSWCKKHSLKIDSSEVSGIFFIHGPRNINTRWRWLFSEYFSVFCYVHRIEMSFFIDYPG